MLNDAWHTFINIDLPEFFKLDKIPFIFQFIIVLHFLGSYNRSEKSRRHQACVAPLNLGETTFARLKMNTPTLEDTTSVSQNILHTKIHFKENALCLSMTKYSKKRLVKVIYKYLLASLHKVYWITKIMGTIT